MKTKFILHGGFMKGVRQEDDNFFREILKTAPENTKILLVYFAEPPEKVDQRREEDLDSFNRNRGSKVVSFDIATEKDFLKQIESSDIIYLHGGGSARIMEILKQYSGIEELFKGKIVAGDSAGANVLTRAFYSTTGGGLMYGLGIIPIKLICHYTPDKEGRLDGISDDLETLKLKEFEIRTYEI